MKKCNIQIFSQAEDLRLYVIEHSLQIETLTSEAIGSLLGVDYKASKSFGFGSSSLSFNQKIQIIQDIKGLDSDMAKKLTCLMNVGNKFAHIQEVDSFDKLFEIAKNGNWIKKILETYSLEEKKDDDEKYQFLFFKLADEIANMLYELQVQEGLTKSVLKAEKDFQKSHLEAYRKVIAKTEGGKELNDEILDETMKKIPHLKIHRKK